ncbi:unnamed protein product [Thelazia callipaeda]|uniref:DHC_N2 domain-containing protein n=1 Tax=Thelazia callipaeda TaxID=103827 RepID=A0A0N5D8V0_THECL|nr:unnamed protein product [Thelazia callipaeda]
MNSTMYSVSLHIKGKLVNIEQKRGNLSVNYSDRLLQLLREVRQLIGLGFVVPRKIVECANTGEQFCKYAITLKQLREQNSSGIFVESISNLRTYLQIVHFYNTVDQQMLPCQQAMMLDEAMIFEKLMLSNQKDEMAANVICRDNPNHLREFVERLQEAAERLTLRNRRLRKVHNEISDKMKQLINWNLPNELSKWKNVMTEIRGKVAEQERNVGYASNMVLWLSHWDLQLYKILQLQYHWGIESFHTQISPVQIQLVFNNQQLELRPPLEDIRVKCYRELRKFVSIPLKFRGIQDTEQYRKMELEKNVIELVLSFLCLRNERNRSVNMDWIVLGQVDLESLMLKHFKCAADWENQIKLLKNKARDAQKLPSEVRLEYILISTTNVRNAIDDMLQRLFDALIWTLRYSINNQILDVDQFLSQAIKTLNCKPQSADEIAEVNKKHAELVKCTTKMQQTVTLINEKNALLRSVSGTGVEQLSVMLKQWNVFESMLDNQQLMIKEQVGFLKANVSNRSKSLNAEVENLFVRWAQFKPNNDVLGDNDLFQIIQFIKEIREEFIDLQQKQEALFTECEQLGLSKPKMPMFDEIASDLEVFENKWLLYEQFTDGLRDMANEEWVLFRSKLYQFDEYLHEWDKKLKYVPVTNITTRLRKDVDQFKEMSSALKYCTGEIWGNDHWLELFRLIKMPKGTTLGNLRFEDFLTACNMIIRNVETLKVLNERAQGEIVIREAIKEIELWATQIKDSEALLHSLKNSPYYAHFTDEASVWEMRLAETEQYVEWLNLIQRKWIYLEPIFGRGSLPSEVSRFNRVDADFRVILNDVVRDRRIISLSMRSLKSTLEQIIDQLNRCQKALNHFIEEKRNAFPRFYFMGDEDLLELLGQSMNIAVIQAHLKKLFQGIRKVSFDETNKMIIAMVSNDNEVVMLSKPVVIGPQVEIWLQALLEEMRNTLQKLVVSCVSEEHPDPRKYPSQVLCLSEQIRFCEKCERLLDSKDNLQSYRKHLTRTLTKYTNFKTIDPILKLKLRALVLDIIHNIRIVNELIDSSPCSKFSWVWQKQLRFYMESGDRVSGNSTKLVHTPLIDKCYLTLTQALSLGFGGNPFGPAGTGKTESVKSLANLFGRQVIVFNCDAEIDVYSMNRIFIGLVNCGAWGCFDEFNRLDQTVLSAVSMQIQVIQNAIKSRLGKCILTHKEVTLVTVDPNSAIFITLNPVAKGYAARQILPDNLKQLFRPVVMSLPDYELIAEALLTAEGFYDAKKLSQKLITVFELSRSMLSWQQHYDWGLRALKAVLRSCGNLLNCSSDKSEIQVVVDVF